MLPRRQFRDEFYRLFQTMEIPVTLSRGRINRYLYQDLPAINVTTFQDEIEYDEAVHSSSFRLEYSQTVTIELHMPVGEDDFENELDRLEEEFWTQCSAFDIQGVDLSYQNGEVTPVLDVDHPFAIKTLYFLARYSVDSRMPNLIIN